MISHPNAGAEDVNIVLAVLFIAGGLLRAAEASVIKFPCWGLTVLAGLVSVGLGVYLVANGSAASAYFLGIVTGVDLFFEGGALLAFASAIHRLRGG